MVRAFVAMQLGVLVFLAGYWASIRSHGDWIMMRTQSGQCAAFDPSSVKVIGTWEAGVDRCHMSAFIWKQIIERPLRGWK